MNFVRNYLLFIILYAISNKIYEDYNILNEVNYQDTIVNKVFNNDLIRHYEIINNSYYDFIVNSSVCKLGKLAFYLWSILLIINYFTINKHIQCVINYIFYITVILTLLMNLPLFIRSIPAFILLYYILFY